jgi:epoxyqueuosine reductase QueG
LIESTEQLESVVEILAWLSMDDETLNASCQRWYVHKRDMTWIRRNLLIVLGNIAEPSNPDVVDAIRKYVSDSRSELRAHAVWAAARLGLTELINHEDSDPMVCDELLHLPTLREGL